LTQKEFAEIAGVSRVTANLWCTGKMHPHRFIADRISTLLLHIESAILHDDLPVPDGIDKGARALAIKQAIVRSIKRTGG
jgi:DNA-binding XRE family transcriptional regulator